MINWIRKKIVEYRQKRALRKVKDWLISKDLIEPMSDEEFERLCELICEKMATIVPLTGITVTEAIEGLSKYVELLRDNN